MVDYAALRAEIYTTNVLEFLSRVTLANVYLLISFNCLSMDKYKCRSTSNKLAVLLQRRGKNIQHE